MYKEVAIDPACMASIEYYNLLKQHFGYDQGRYVSADVRSWTKEAIEHVKVSGIQPVKEKSIKNYLNKLSRSKSSKEFHLTEDRKKIKGEDWNNWLNNQQDLRPYSITISESADLSSTTISDINDGCEAWEIKSSISVIKDGKAIVEAVAPLIEISENITLVDQHFRLTSNKTLLNLIQHLNSCSFKKLVIVTAMDSPDAMNVFTREYGEKKQNDFEIIWFKAPDKFFHDRYIISEVGAMRSGHGFMADVEKGIHADQANLNIISKEEAERTLSDFEALKEKGEVMELFRI